MSAQSETLSGGQIGEVLVFPAVCGFEQTFAMLPWRASRSTPILQTSFWLLLVKLIEGWPKCQSAKCAYANLTPCPGLKPPQNNSKNHRAIKKKHSNLISLHSMNEGMMAPNHTITITSAFSRIHHSSFIINSTVAKCYHRHRL